MTEPRPDCERAAQLLPDYWQDNLSGLDRAADRAWLQSHIKLCAHCAGLGSFWNRLDTWPDAQPTPAMRERFQALIEGASLPQPALHAQPAAGGWLRWLGRAPLAQALALTLVLALGGAAGWLLRGHLLAPSPEAGQVAALRQEVQTTQQLAVLSLLQQQSPNDRLQGVNWSTRLGAPDAKVVDALLHSLNYDSSPDVRLAALDALQRAATPGSQAAPGIAQALVASFREQQSPLVQVALLDSLAELHPSAARPLLQDVSRNDTYLPEVRERAQRVLAQPTWN